MVEATKQKQAQRPRANRSPQHPRGRTKKPPQRPPAESVGSERRKAADQLGAIVTKGLDLAEASLSLGLTMVSRVATAAQQQVLDRMTVRTDAGEGGAPGGPGFDHAPPAEAGRPFGPSAPDITVPEQKVYCITNRQPLAPGGTVRVSFSINNDSSAAPKKVSLRLEGFTGETEGRRIGAGLFVLKPTSKTIAPMDFEKFVLEGALPQEVPPDVYDGWVVVSSGDEFRIPVRLVVLAL